MVLMPSHRSLLFMVICWFAFAISGLLISASASESCPQGWVLFGESCISISSVNASWHQAERNCTSEYNNSNLINLNNETERSDLEDILRNLTRTSNKTDKFYIGVKARTLNGSIAFNWTDSENMYNLSRLETVLNKTNSSLITTSQWLCVYFDTKTEKWKMGNCSMEARFICRQPLEKAVSKYCQAGWHEIKNWCIYLSTQSTGWHKACEKCRERKGYMVWINNQDKDQQIIHLLNTTAPSEYYIGLRRNKSNMDFFWNNKKMYNYTNWHSANETNRTADKAESHLCAYYGSTFKWRLDGGCTKKRKFICHAGKIYPSKKPQPKPSKNPDTSKSTSNVPSSPIGSTEKSTFNTPIGSSGDQAKNQINMRIEKLKGQKISDAIATQELEETKAILSKLEFKKMDDVQNAIEGVENLGGVLIEGMKKAGNLTKPKKIQVKNDALVLGVTLMPPNVTEKIHFPDNDSKGKIKLPESVLKLAQKVPSNSDGVGVVSFFMRSTSSEESNDKKPFLNSGIMSAKVSVPDGTIKNLEKNLVVIELTHNKALESNSDQTLCAFIDTNTSEYSTSGCKVASFNKTNTVCECNHMTSFAVLLDVHGNVEKVPTEHKFALLIVSIVGCCIALLCFIAALFAFHCVISERRRRRSETLSIHKNLAVAEIFALMFFLLAYGVVKPKDLCYAIAFLLHYSLMAVFCWMLVEGLNLHRGTVKVFVTSSRMKVYYVIGWGVPLIFVITTAAVGQLEYHRDDFCWISQSLIWAFAGPVAVILFINLIILCIAIRVMLRRPKYVADRDENDKRRITERELRIAFRTTIILLPLLGLTWCLGFLATNDVTGNIVIQYLFAIVNTLQGLYFFLAHCMYDEDIQKATNRTSTRLKSYFTNTLSRSNPSNSSSSNKPAFYKVSSKAKNDIVFEMPSASSLPKEGAPVLLNHNDLNLESCGDLSKIKEPASLHIPGKRNRVGSCNSDKDSPASSSNNEENDSNGILFRRANSTIGKPLKSKSSCPRRAKSFSDAERMKLSKQCSNESNESSVSGRSNTAFLNHKC